MAKVEDQNVIAWLLDLHCKVQPPRSRGVRSSMVFCVRRLQCRGVCAGTQLAHGLHESLGLDRMLRTEQAGLDGETANGNRHERFQIIQAH